LSKQLFSTRRSIAHSIVSSVLKNETIIESPEDVDGVLELCHVLIKDQTDSSSARAGSVGGAGMNGQSTGGANGVNANIRKQSSHFVEREEMAEEQGWVARMVHLFRAESLDVQFEVSFFLRV
jgi:vacuolar protein sorting-associated protein 35